jgi:hypothetical protein
VVVVVVVRMEEREEGEEEEEREDVVPCSDMSNTDRERWWLLHRYAKWDRVFVLFDKREEKTSGITKEGRYGTESEETETEGGMFVIGLYRLSTLR